MYRTPPTIKRVDFHRDGQLIQGWRIDMVAAFFAGFKPQGLKLYNPTAEPEPEPGATTPRLRLLNPESIKSESESTPETTKASPEETPPAKPKSKLRLILSED